MLLSVQRISMYPDSAKHPTSRMLSTDTGCVTQQYEKFIAMHAPDVSESDGWCTSQACSMPDAQTKQSFCTVPDQLYSYLITVTSFPPF